MFRTLDLNKEWVQRHIDTVMINVDRDDILIDTSNIDTDVKEDLNRGYPLITLAYEGGGRGQANANKH